MSAGLVVRKTPLLEVENLHISFDTPTGPLYAVNGVSLHLDRGEMLGVLGESGCGKSAMAKAIMGILQIPPGRIRAGSMHYAGRELTELPSVERRALMGKEIAWIPQDPLSSLNPTFRIGWQLMEAIRVHHEVSKKQARERCVELLASVGLPAPRNLLDRYPFELSGGMRQRVLIAMAIAPEPKILIADEPTTALDVTIQAEILLLLRKIQQDTQMGVLMITHDSALAGAVADRVAIMYAGQIVETGRTGEVFGAPSHPYTRGLMQSTPSLALDDDLIPIPGSPPKLMDAPSSCSFANRCSRRVERCNQEMPSLVPSGGTRLSACFEHVATAAEVGLIRRFLDAGVGRRQVDEVDTGPAILVGRGLVKVFGRRRRRSRRPADETRAVDGIDFDLHAGETLCVVGESGSGKSTLARLILGLEQPTAGTVDYRGSRVVGAGMTMPRTLRREIQFVAQDPYSSLNPRMQVGDIIAEGWRVHRGIVALRDREGAATTLLDRVGISGNDILRRYPHEFSGGQRQRIAIARALALEPSIVVLDEPISSLDVSVQAQVIRLLKDLQDERGMAYIFIAHDLSVVEYLAKTVIVMHHGKVVEQGPGRRIFVSPVDSYTRRLSGSNPRWQADGTAVISIPT